MRAACSGCSCGILALLWRTCGVSLRSLNRLLVRPRCYPRSHGGCRSFLTRMPSMKSRMIAALFSALPLLVHAACPDYQAPLAAPPLPVLEQQPFLKLHNSLLAERYQPWHMVHDVLVADGQSARLVAKFDYDLVMHKDLEGERVHAWLFGSGMQEWESLGVHITDSDGKIELELAPRPLGDYRVHLRVE